MSTTEAVNLRDASAVCDVFEQAAEVNTTHAARHGAVVDLGDKGRVIATGDMHDHSANFQASIKLARLNKATDHHLVLQELVHGEHLVNGMDLSYRILARAAELAIQHPGQVHHVLSNHELAQMNTEGILKEGVSVVEAFDEGLDYVFGDAAPRVAKAIARYISALPLAVRCANGVFIAHSLPSPREREPFDPAVLDRELTAADLVGPDGHAYTMTWGRNLTQKWADELADRWGVKVFILGHQHAEMGWDEYGQTMLVINSDHEHGVAIPIDLSRQYTRDDLTEAAVILAGV
ncbi:MAG: hypothetical protein GC159_22800 [Phycisphaera sp.]|nr:hypothetical protein [Phycisphaera sp.]